LIPQPVQCHILFLTSLALGGGGKSGKAPEPAEALLFFSPLEPAFLPPIEMEIVSPAFREKSLAGARAAGVEVLGVVRLL